MKKIIITFMLISFAFAGLSAQNADVFEVNEKVENNNEVYLTTGTASLIGLFSGTFVAIADSLANYNKEEKTDEDVFPISFSAGYNHFFWDHLGVGGFVSYESFKPLNLFTVQAKITGQYGWEHFKLYHAVSGGILMVPDGGLSPVFDVTLLGLKADFDNFNIFVEGCLPSTGIIKAGASFKF